MSYKYLKILYSVVSNLLSNLNKDGFLSAREKDYNIKRFNKLNEIQLNPNSKLTRKQKRKIYQLCNTLTSYAAHDFQYAETAPEISRATVLINSAVTLQLFPKVHELLEFDTIKEQPIDIYREEPKDDFNFGFCNLFEPEKCEKSCHRDAICTRKGEDYVCQCKVGYVGNGFKCKYECLVGEATCGKNTECGPRCFCLPGFGQNIEPAKYGGCYDIDECATGKHQCQLGCPCRNFLLS